MPFETKFRTDFSPSEQYCAASETDSQRGHRSPSSRASKSRTEVASSTIESQSVTAALPLLVDPPHFPGDTLHGVFCENARISRNARRLNVPSANHVLDAVNRLIEATRNYAHCRQYWRVSCHGHSVVRDSGIDRRLPFRRSQQSSPRKNVAVTPEGAKENANPRKQGFAL